VVRNTLVTESLKPKRAACVRTRMVATFIAAILYLGSFDREIAHDPHVRAEWWEMLADARYGFAENEEAMFIVRNDDGSLCVIRWTPAGMVRGAQWHAPMPRGVIAIAHTHPNRLPRPSPADVRTAMRMDVPVYVITRSRIVKTAGGKTIDVARGEWRQIP